MTKIPRNSPCPCGSGKKYKRCCGSESASGRSRHDASNTGQRVQEEIRRRGAKTIDEMNAIAHEVTQSINEQPIDEFLDLSPTQMAKVLHAPLNSPDVVTFNEQWHPGKAPALQLFDLLVSGIGEEGIKATGQGNLPIKLCREILEAQEEGFFYKIPRIRSELEYGDLHTIRITAELAGLIKHQKSRFSLTKKGKALAQKNDRGERFATLFKAHVSQFNWAFRDAYPDANIIQSSWLFTLYCLSLFGQEWRPASFYEDVFVAAFPMVLNEFEGTAYASERDEAGSCYSCRALQRFAYFWGLIDCRPEKNKRRTFGYQIRALDLNDWLTFHC